MRPGSQNALPCFELVRVVIRPPGQVMHAPGAPGAARNFRGSAEIDVLPGRPVANAKPLPVVLVADFLKAKRLDKKRNDFLHVALQHPRAFQAANLVLGRNRASLPESEWFA